MAYPKQFKDNNDKKRKPKPLKPLTGQQQALVDWYFHPEVKFRKNEALIRAGYSEATARSNPQAIFGHPSVAAEVERRHEERRLYCQVTVDDMTERLLLMADANIARIVGKLKNNGWDVSALTPREQYAISEVKTRRYMQGRGPDATEVTEVQVKSESRLGAVQALTKLHGLNKEKEDGGRVTVNILQEGRNRLAKTVVSRDTDNG